MAGNNDNGR